MQVRDVFFGEWLPSRPDYQNPGCVEANNAIASPGGYRPLLGPNPTGETVTGACQGARLFFQIDGTETLVGGTATGLFKIDGGAVTSTTGLTDIGSGETWDFCQFNDIIIATALTNNPQYLDDIDTDTSWSDLPGSPPKARYCARVGDFVMLGNIENAPNRVGWCSFNAPTSAWAQNRLTQASFVDMPREFGPVHRVTGGRYPLVFQERGVSRFEYVGPPQVWQKVEVEQSRGALAPFSVVSVGFIKYFLAQDGFYATDGSSFQPIGTDRVNQWFFEQSNGDEIQETHGAVDYVNEAVVWAFKSTGSSVFDRLIIYSYGQNRWSSGTVTLGRLVETADNSITLEQLGVLYPVLESVPGSLDDERWRSKFRSLAAFIDGETETALAPFNGASLEANFETAEFGVQAGRWGLITGARPLAYGDVNAMLVGAVPYLNDRTSQVSAYRMPSADGFSPLRVTGRTMRMGLRIPEGVSWDEVQGLQTRGRMAGRR